MNAKLSFAAPGGLMIFSAALLAGVIGGSLISAVVLLFQSRGTPMEVLAAAERACVQHIYKSERDACMNDWLAVRQAKNIANR